MKRLFAAPCAIALAAMLFAIPANAADPIKVVVPFAAGGPVDALARIMAQELSARLATDVVVENRGGAGGLLAVDQVARAPADGRTILFASVGAFVITNALKPQPGYDQLKIFAPAGTNITHVPYRGIAPALNDIMGGHIDFLNGDITVLYPLVQQGTIRALAVAGNARSSLLPDVPTAAEAGFPGIYMENWYGALVPAATPPDVVAKLEAAIMDAVKNPDVWAKISANGVYGPQDAKTFRAQIEKDVAYWGAEVKKLGIQGE